MSQIPHSLPLISYAQNQEDIVLWRALRDVENGFYVDVGANHPLEDSVTKLFYDRGWAGINVEPSPEYFEKLVNERPRDITLACAAGAHNGTVTFYEASTRGWSTSDATVGEHYVAQAEAEARQVEQLTLDSILERHAPAQIHFLKIDVEGAEAVVLAGLDLGRFRPWIVVVEALDPVTHAMRSADWEPRLLASGYSCVFFDGLNRYYLAAEHADLAGAFSAPPNVLDAFTSSTQAALENRLREAQVAMAQVASDLSRTLSEKEELARDLNAERESTTTRLGQAHQAMARAAADLIRAQQANEELARTLETERDRAQRLRELEAKLAAVSASADHHSAAYRAVMASLSWRITAPLRQLNAVRAQGGDVAKKQAKGAARKAISLVSRQVDRSPRLKRTIVQFLMRFPVLSHRLRSIVAAQRTRAAMEPVVLAELADSELRTAGQEDLVALPRPCGSRILYVYVEHTAECPTSTGVQRVTRSLAKGLVARGELVRFVRWHPESQRCILVNAEEREHLARWNGPEVSEEERGFYPPAGRPQIPVADVVPGENHWLIVPEVTHITFHQAPVTLDLILWARRAGLKSGFVFYDAIPLRRPELEEVAPRHSMYMQQLLLADVVWPISDWTGADLRAFWTRDARAEPGTMPEVQTQALSGESALRERVTRPAAGEPLILSVGSIEPRKNQVQLIHAFLAYRARHPHSPWRLVLVGNLHPSVAPLVARATASGNAIEHLGHVSDKDLDRLYERCSFTVFPSLEEGFGLPILESLWYGKPCVCANFGSMAEVAREGGCLTLDTGDAAALEDGITRLIEERGLRDRLAAEAVTRPIKTWTEYSAGISARIDREGRPAARLGLVYFWIDATLQFSKNTGIQRVTRQLARSLLQIGAQLVPVKDDGRGGFAPATPQELAFFAGWNGPDACAWHGWAEPGAASTDGWFFMPELPLNRSAADRARLLDFARGHGLRCAALFYDAIPWKMRRIYPAPFSEAHRAYMMELHQYDLVLPISRFARDDLVDFLGAHLPRPQSLEDRIKAAPLAGEFAESTRLEQLAAPHEGPLRILCVGTVEPRKNHETLLRAFEIASSRAGVEMHLTLAGGSHSIEPALGERVRAFVEPHPCVSWEEDADDARLRQLHLESDFTVYPSLEEGFGLPILESLWYARPCICADFGAMLEVAEGGGCLTVDVRDAEVLADAIVRMATEPGLRDRLAREALARPFKSWSDYATEVAVRMAQALPPPAAGDPGLSREEISARAAAMHLAKRPKLSVCISTYNRAEWLSTSLRNWSRMYPRPVPGVEFVVCDNTSTDHTPDVVAPYLDRPDFSYHRNAKNVGMLGNLRETAHRARGEYVWILGDDDLLLPGAIERVLGAIDAHPGLALVYLNYAYTREDDARKVTDFDAFFAAATPIVPPEADRAGPIRSICARNENFFTAIYTLVFRRDHAIRAYSQDTSGRPFSSMPTCIPTTTYVLGHMMEEPGVWIGSPQLVVNLNVSWMKYAPLWILERVPEVYEVAERRGVPAEDMDRWRVHTLPGVVHYFQEIFSQDPLGNAQYFSAERLVRRFRHLPEFAKVQAALKDVYARAHAEGHPAARRAPDKVFPEPAFS